MAASKMTLTLLQCLLLALVMAAHLDCGCAQYHFSNGWYAGKKRSAPSPSSSSSSSSSSSPSSASAAEAVNAAAAAAAAEGSPLDGLRSFESGCGMRQEALALIERIVQEEALRMQKVCLLSASLTLQEYLQSAARKLAGDAKW